MLKISPISGTIWYYKKRNLEIVISFEQAGTGESYSIYILRHWTTEQGETSVPRFLLPYYEWTAYFNGTHGSPDALHYYIDIDDDKLVQGNYLEFKLQLWRINRHWDSKHLSGYDIYCINDVGHSEIVNITSIEEFESVPMKTEAKINVTTIGVEKANTIAIYETNGTVFNGHYQEQERMNIIQLYVNDSGAGTPFVEGPNVIVIPTSLFTETIFNAYVQNETLHETPIYSADDEIFKFISVGRDGSTEQACDEIDFVIIRFNISSQDAMEILNLLLECLVNETTNETSIVYSYASTKINGTLGVMMNLPISVLGFVPWFCEKESSPFGKKPKTKKQAFWAPLKNLASFAIGLIITIGMAILELVELIADFVMEILMEWLPILEYILWLIICALMLIFIYIMFAVTLILVIISFITIIPFLSFFSRLTDGELKIKMNSLTVQNDDTFTTIKYKIDLVPIDYFAFMIPTIYVYFITENTTFNFPFNFFTDSILLPSSETFETLFEAEGNGTSQSSGISISSNPSDKSLANEQFLKGMSSAVGLFGTIMGITGTALGLASKIHKALIIIILALSALSLTLSTLLFFSYILDNDEITEYFSYGLATGTLINMLVLILVAIFSKSVSNWAGILIKILSSIKTLFNIAFSSLSLNDSDLKKSLQDEKFIMSWVSLGFGFLSFLILDPDVKGGAIVLYLVILGIFLYHFFLLPKKKDLEPF